MIRRLVLIGLAIGLLARPAVAHEVRPAYLEIRQSADDAYDVVWKQPTLGDLAVHLVPHLSNGWLENAPNDQYAAQGFLIRHWTIKSPTDRGLAGVRVEIEGLRDTITDAFVHIDLTDGTRIDSVLRPERPDLLIPADGHARLAVPEYLLLGISHILTGPDHLLFVLGLLLIVKNRWSLLRTVSAFTVAHSITLTATILGKIAVPAPFVETMISLSILFLGPEILRARRGETSLTLRFPWAVAFAFGLFHGMGFASGLTALGFQPGQLFAALALFNIGVEIGQLCFIAAVFALAHAVDRMNFEWVPRFAAFPAYLVGIGGAYWTIQCSVTWLGVS